METSNMRKVALIIAVAAVPTGASAKDFTVPAIIPAAQAATPAPQPATPPASLIQGGAPHRPPVRRLPARRPRCSLAAR